MSAPTPDELRNIAHRCSNWPCEAETDDLEYAAAALLACARILDMEFQGYDYDRAVDFIREELETTHE